MFTLGYFQFHVIKQALYADIHIIVYHVYEDAAFIFVNSKLYMYTSSCPDAQPVIMASYIAICIFIDQSHYFTRGNQCWILFIVVVVSRTWWID